MCIILKTAAPEDYFGFEVKTVVKGLLKLWLFKSAKCYGIHFEKTALKVLSFCIFSLATAV